ncbi:MAG: 4-vinyl reductase [Candidatus Nanohaloarchaea archaeon]|nr:4-vinyl reductase [Candidatus Nanohaloarchaea archaeon]
MSENTSAFFSSLIEKGQFRVDERGHALLFGEYLFLIPPPVIIKLQERLAEEIGYERMADVVSDIGRYHIQQAVERHDDRYNLSELSRSRFLDYVDNINNILGWGEIQVHALSTDEGTFKVRVKHPTLPATYLSRHEKHAERPICHYLRGLLSKQFELLVSQNLNVQETTCAAVEGDRCIFEGEPTD